MDQIRKLNEFNKDLSNVKLKQTREIMKIKDKLKRLESQDENQSGGKSH